MSFGSGLLNDESSGSLAKLLADPKKSADMLKKLKAAQAASVKATKELTGTKSVTAYRKNQEAEAEAAEKRAADAIASIETERKKAQKSASEARARIEKREKKLSAGEASVSAVATEQGRRHIEMDERAEALGKREAKADAAIRAAHLVKDEYTAKLKDLKDRMKGL